MPSVVEFEQAIQKIRADVVATLTEAKAHPILLTDAGTNQQFGCIACVEGIEYTMEIYNDLVVFHGTPEDRESEHFAFVNSYHSDNCESNIVLDAITNSIDPHGSERELEWLVTEWENSADLPGSGKNEFQVQIIWVPGRGAEGGRGIWIRVVEKLMCALN